MSGALFKRLMENQSGNILMLAAAGMPILIGAAGLATDTVQWTLWKRQIQREADSAALAGAYAVSQGFSASDSATADINRMALVTLTQTPTIENAPTTGSYAGNMQAVRVALQTSRELPFSRLLGINAPTITGEATAAIVTEGTYCLVSLENSTNVGITIQGSATVNLGCGMATNSRASNAVVAGGSSSITATPVAAVGGLSASDSYVSPTTLLPHSFKQSDPYAKLPTPVPTSCSGKVNVNPNATRNLSPGCYRGFDIKGTLNLAPGVYYVDGDSFSANSQAVITGTNVTIVLTSTTAATNPSSIATVNINGGATVNLTSSTSGDFAGVLFYQDRRALDSGTNKINGNSSSSYEGGFYFANQEMLFNGTSGMQTKCIQMVVKRVTFTGNNNVANQCRTDPGSPKAFTVVRVRLVA